MIKHLLHFACFVCLLQLTACQQKPDWKYPTKVPISLNLLSQGIGGPGDLTFTQGQISLANISIEGQLVDGDDFRFERNFPQGLVVDFNSAAILSELSFDLPQGNYSTLKINFETIPSNKNIFVEGIFDYNNPQKPDAFVDFEVDSAQVFSLTVVSPQGNASFSIFEENNNNIEILLNPPYWFKNITATMMNNSSTVMINNQPHILINRLNNPNIYQNAKARIGGDAKSTLK